MDRILVFLLTSLELSYILILWSKFHKDKEKVFVKSLVLILSTALVVAIGYTFPALNTTMINYSVLIIGVYFLFSKSLSDVIVEFCIVILISLAIQLVFILIFSVFFGLPQGSMATSSMFIINSLVFFISLLIFKYMPYEEVYLKNKLRFRIIYFYIINILFYVILTRFIWQYDFNLFVDNLSIFIIFIALLIILTKMFLQDIIRINEDAKNAELYERYSEVTDNVISDVRRRQHDFKNHLNTIYGIVQVTEEEHMKEKLMEYIENLISSFQGGEKIIQIDNKVLSAIIFCKVQEAMDRGIEFIYNIEGNTSDIPVKDYELTEIIYNLLDNAFDGVLENHEDHRQVALNIYNTSNHMVIEVANNGLTLKPEILSKIFKKGFSTKGSLSRGFGLFNVKKIVDFYGGNIEVSLENNRTTFKLLF